MTELVAVQAVAYIGNEPRKQHAGDAGFDLVSGEAEVIIIDPGARYCVRTGTWLRIPPRHVGLVCPRSGLAVNYGITVLNAPGVIDASFRGEVGVILHNTSDTPFMVAPRDRIAQLLIVPLAQHVVFDHDDDFLHDDSPRGTAGFGSTGGSTHDRGGHAA